MSQIAKKTVLARMWCWILPILLCCGAGSLLAHPTVAHVRVKVYVSDTESWCCGHDWKGSCDCRRREAYGLHVNGFDQQWQVAGTFYPGGWYEATFYNVNLDWPTFREKLRQVRFFNTARNWVIGHTAVTVWAVGGAVIRDHDTDVGDYWVGTWNNFTFDSVIWNYTYNTPPDIAISSTDAVTMNWNAGRTFLKRITTTDPDGCYSIGLNLSLSNPALGDLSYSLAGCSGKTSTYDVYFTPKSNAFGSSWAYLNIYDGNLIGGWGIQVNVNRVPLPPTFAEIRNDYLVRADHTVTLQNVFNVADEYTSADKILAQCISTSSDVLPVSKVQITAGSAGGGWRNIVVTSPNNVPVPTGKVTLNLRLTDGDGKTTDSSVTVRCQENYRYGSRFTDDSGDSLGLSLERDVDYVNVGANSMFGDNDFTIEAWVYMRSYQYWSRIIDFGNGAGRDNVLLAASYETSGKPSLQVYRGLTANAITATEALPLNKWTHLAAVNRNGTGFIYFDGRQVATGPLQRPLSVPRSTAYIGKSLWGDQRLDAVIDEVRIWNRARSTEELVSAAYPPILPTTAGLVGYWSFNDRNDTPMNLANGTKSQLVGGVYVPGIANLKTVSVQEDVATTVTTTLNDLIAGHTLTVLRRPREGQMTESIGGTASKQFTGVAGPKSFWTSYYDAITKRGRLATVASEADSVAVTAAAAGIGAAWLGATDLDVEAGTSATGFKWLSGVTTSYSNWTTGEPNNSNNEDFLHLNPGGKWNDNQESAGLGYVLQTDKGSSVTLNYTPMVNFNRQDSPNTELFAEISIRDASGKEWGRQRVQFNVEAVDDAPVVRNDGYVTLNGSGFLYVPGQNNAFAFEGRSAFSMEAWVRPTARQEMVILSRYQNGVYGNFKLGLNALGQLQLWREHAPYTWVVDNSSGGALTLNAWSHIAATYDGSMIRLYVNGQLRNETADESSIGSGWVETRAGAIAAESGSFKGDLDELRIWNVARSETELRSNYRNTLSGFETGLIGYYRFEEGFGVWATDLSKEGDEISEDLRFSTGGVTWSANGDTPTKVITVPEDHAGFEIFVGAVELDRTQTITLGEPTQPAHGLIRRLPSRLGGIAYVYTPAADYSGSDSFQYTASANGVTVTGSIAINVENINDAPVIANLENQVLQEEVTHYLPFKVTDVDSATVSLSAKSSDQTILPTANIQITGEGANRTLALSPYEGAYGQVVVTVSASDTIDVTERAIVVNFIPKLAYATLPVNDPGSSTVSYGTAIDDNNRVAGYYKGTGPTSIEKPIFHEQMLNNGPSADVGAMTGKILGLKVHLNGTNHYAVGYALSNTIATPYRFSRVWIDDRAAASARAYAAETDATKKEAAAYAAAANAFVGIREATNWLTFPIDYRHGYATAVNAIGSFAGYLAKANQDEVPILVEFTRTNIATDQILKESNGTVISGRALAVNRYNMVTGYRLVSSKKRAFTHNGSALTDLLPPAGFDESVGTSIDDNGTVVGYLIDSTGKRKAAQYKDGGWSYPSGAVAAGWTQSEATSINSLGQIVGESTLSNGTKRAFLWIGRSAYDLTDLQPLGSKWKLERAEAINGSGQVVGTGKFYDGGSEVTRAFLATPASVIGKRVARPEGTVARTPIIDILEGGAGDNSVNSFFWSDVEKALFAIRPVKATIRWYKNANTSSLTLDVVPRLTVTVWPKEPEIHIAGSPVEVNPAAPDSLYTYYALHYTTTPAATVDSVTKVFNTSIQGTGHSVVRYLKSGGLEQDSTTQSNLFHVVRTHLWNDASLLTDSSWPIGSPIVNTNHSDYKGRNGYLFFEKTAVDSIGENAAYDRPTRTGTLIPVNELHPEAPIGDTNLVVVWYKMNTDLNVAWANKPVRYTPTWPVSVGSIIIASTRGSDPFGRDPITPVTYPDARIYNQPIAALPGFNPNEEHAMILPGSIGEAAYALRNDLNSIKNYSKPYVLLKYRHPIDGLWRHKVYQVLTEQRPFLFNYPATVGTEIQPPYPLSILPIGPGNYISKGQQLALKDYNGKVYARQAGVAGAVNSDLELRFYYPMQPGFWYDINGDGINDARESEFIPWLDRNPATTPATPIPIVYTVRWPDEVPVLEVGDTLFEAKKGLPGVANWASAQLVYDTLNPTFTNSFRVGSGILTVPPTNVVRLYDPMSERLVQLAATEKLPDQIRLVDAPAGRKAFRDLPYPIQVRLSYDPTSRRLGFKGFYDNTTVGEPLLLPNILSPDERDRIKQLDGTGSVSAFDKIVDRLYDLTRNPNRLDLNNDGQADQAFLVGYQYPISKTNYANGTAIGYEYDKTRIIIESLPSGLKALTAAIGGNIPAVPKPGMAATFVGASMLRSDWLPTETLDSFTWEVWVKRKENNREDVILARGTDVDAFKFRFTVDNQVEFSMGNEKALTASRYTLDVGQWHHWAGTFDGVTRQLELFRDGESVATKDLSRSTWQADGPTTIGGDMAGGRFSGSLDEVRIWHGQARDASQLLAYRFQTLVAGQSGLVGYWTFDQADSDRFRDNSGYSHNLEEFGATHSTYTGVTPGTLATLYNQNDWKNEKPNQSRISKGFYVAQSNPNLEYIGTRLQALLVPPLTGKYTFWIAADDEAELYLSTTESPARKVKLASVAGTTQTNQWDKFTTQKSQDIELEAGKAYYIEAVSADNGGGDYVYVRWRLPDGNWEEGNPNIPIPQYRLLPYAVGGTAVAYGSVGTENVNGQPWGIPPRYITLMQNNDPGLAGLPVSLSVVAIGAGPHGGDMKVLPPSNVFDERLSLRLSSDFGGEPDRFEFEWWYKPDAPDFRKSVLPEIGSNGEVSNANGWIKYVPGTGAGKNMITLGENGESGLLVMSDNWFLARYKGYNVGTNTKVWSPWIGDPSSLSKPLPMLAEGWVKRVVRGLNPFDERATDLSTASASARVSMMQQAGRRYEGDVAFNPDPNYLNSIGLIEAYETVLRRARSLSTDGSPPVNYAPANTALLYMASRIADLYTLLGNEATADASDPTIGFTTSSSSSATKDATYGSAASSIFAFQNQLDSLLEEELGLLRGRDDSSAGTQGAPIYNRLFWNFTQGEGEVAYSQVYNMKDQNADGRIDEKDAMILYPQGHGDAWGHYLTATKTYYELLRNPNFTWVPRSENMLLAGVPLKVDYQDERKFALAAAGKARVGADIVNLTYRLKYVEDPAGQWQGYSDTDTTRSWGVDEWGMRAGMGAYFDWVMANAILPATDPNPAHTGIDKIDRTTVKELVEIASGFSAIERQMDQADQGLNPLGLAQGVVPFDIDPSFLEVGSGIQGRGHFEQVQGRASDALNNAIASFNHLNSMNQAIRAAGDSAQDLEYELEMQDRDYTAKLVEIFGYPYSGDIGPGKTYPSGYDGADLLHFMYVATTEIGNNNTPPSNAWQGIMANMDRELSKWGDLRLRDTSLTKTDNVLAGTDSVKINYPFSASGFAYEAPASWGARRAPGRVQEALSDLVQAETRLKQALKEYDGLIKNIDESMRALDGEIDLTQQSITITEGANKRKTDLMIAVKTLKGVQVALNRGQEVVDGVAEAIQEGIPKSFVAGGFVIGGLACGGGFVAGGDLTSPVRGTLKATKEVVKQSAFGIASDVAEIAITGLEGAMETTDMQSGLDIQRTQLKYEHQQALKQVATMMREEAPLRLEIYNQKEVVQQAAGRFQNVVAEGQRIIEERSAWRKQFAGRATELRYKDMAFRVFRSDAVRQYRDQFELAARYVYLAASAYDYESNLLGSDGKSGRAFLTDIIRHRSPGVVRDGVAIAGLPGLADPMARMDANYKVMKTQMGFNNPQTETGKFSVRNELFRLLDAGPDSASLWQAKLKESLVDDLWQVPEFRRFCRPMAPESAGVQPALVIRFPTTVTFGMNFFGWPLSGGDSAYDPSQYATRIRSAGVWFEGYNSGGMSMTPRVYLVPVGADVLRSPNGLNFETRLWRVVDQKIPMPFPIEQRQLQDPKYSPMLDSIGGSFVEIRKFSSLRAYHDSGDFDPSEASTDSRLIGRSVWNTQWMLIIPGGTLLNDKDQGLETFINSVSDIKLFFQTYAYSGN